MRSTLPCGAPRSSRRPTSPGCGVRTVGARRPRSSPARPANALTPSASSTTGRSSPATSSRIHDAMAGSSPSPGPIAAARLPSQNAASVAAAALPKPGLAVRRQWQRHRFDAPGIDLGADRLGRRHRHQPGAGAQRSTRREHRGARLPGRAGDDHQMSEAALVRFARPRRQREVGGGDQAQRSAARSRAHAPARPAAPTTPRRPPLPRAGAPARAWARRTSRSRRRRRAVPVSRSTTRRARSAGRARGGARAPR